MTVSGVPGRQGVSYPVIRGMGCTSREAFHSLSKAGNKFWPFTTKVAIKKNFFYIYLLCVCVCVYTHLFGG